MKDENDESTDQWLNYQCLINSRRYQYQSPLGSTTGGATALANYPWLDYSVGTDSEFFVNYAWQLANYYVAVAAF